MTKKTLLTTAAGFLLGVGLCCAVFALALFNRTLVRPEWIQDQVHIVPLNPEQ